MNFERNRGSTEERLDQVERLAARGVGLGCVAIAASVGLLLYGNDREKRLYKNIDKTNDNIRALKQFLPPKPSTTGA